MKQIFDNAAPVYQAALERSGHQFKLSYEENEVIMQTKFPLAPMGVLAPGSKHA